MRLVCRAALVAVLSLVGWHGGANAAEPQSVWFNAGGVELLGSGPNLVDFGLGVFDVNEESNGSAAAAGRLELRFGNKFLFVGPAAGILGTSDGGIYGYGGFYADIRFKNFVLTPLLAIGGYRKGSGKDLGGVFEFRESITFAYQFDGGSRLGLQVAHMSNASIYDRNPGQQDVFVTYAVPF